MTEFLSAAATGAEIAAIVASVTRQLRGAAGHNVGFVYVTSPLAGRFGALVAALRAGPQLAQTIWRERGHPAAAATPFV